MRADSFKDILAKFLETNQPIDTETMPAENPISSSQTADIPLVFLDTCIRTSRTKVAAYGSLRQERNLNSPSRNSEVEEKNSVAPKRILPSDLSVTGQKALDCLLRLGALDLEAGLNETQLKKAYRRLIKFYHPDHYPLDLSEQDRKTRIEQFLQLQTAIKTLQIEVSSQLRNLR
jgi:hypothetical protein